MIPQIGASSSVGTVHYTTSDSSAGRALRPDAPARPDSRTGAETARAVEAPQPVENLTPLAQIQLRNLNPPDPNAPAGPPPAFEASILDRQREQALEPPPPPEPEPASPETRQPELRPPAPPEAVQDVAATADAESARRSEEADAAEPEPPGAGAVPADRPSLPARAAEPPEPRPEPRRSGYDVPPSAEYRAEREVATIRRIETPYDTATIDVSR